MKKERCTFRLVPAIVLAWLAGAAHGSLIAPADLIAYWALDGNLTDSAPALQGLPGPGSDGTLTGGIAPTFVTVDGRQALDLRAVGNNYVRTETYLDGGPKTVAVWVNSTFEQAAFWAGNERGASAQSQRLFFGHNSSLRPWLGAGASNSSGGSFQGGAPNDGQWHMFVLTDTGNLDGTGGTVRLYQDRIPTPVRTLNYTGSTASQATTPFVIGQGGGNTPYYANALMDDVAVFNRVLTPLEMARLFEAGSVAAALATSWPDPGMEGIVMPERGIAAHRGASGTHPENTLVAFEEAIRLGAHQIEFDVQMTKDGHIVLMHDATVNRTTNGTGAVSDLTLAEIRALDAGSWKGPQFAGEQVPTLDEALAMMPHNIWLNVHVKGGAALAQAAALEIIGQQRAHQAFLATERNPAQAARELYEDILIGNMEGRANVAQYVAQTIAHGDAFVQFLHTARMPTPEEIAALKEAEVHINYYGTNDPAALAGLYAAGIEFPLVDHVAPMIAAAQELGIEPWQPIYIPEPGTTILLAAALWGLSARGLRKRK